MVEKLSMHRIQIWKNLDNSDIVATDVQRDIGFLIPKSLSTSYQIQKARSRALMKIRGHQANF
jgi:hypothetical protein